MLVRQHRPALRDGECHQRRVTAQGIQVLRDRVAAPDHVPEPHRSFGGVPLQQGLLGVEPAHRVGRAALEPDRHLPAVACQPAGDEFARLVGALENRIHDMPHRDEGLVPGFTPGPRELGSGLHRGQAQVSRPAHPRQQPGGPHRLGGGRLAHQVAEPAHPRVGALVECLLARQVAGGEEEQLRLQIPRVPRRAQRGAEGRGFLAGDRALYGGTDGAPVVLAHLSPSDGGGGPHFRMTPPDNESAEVT